jgi:hypothetical protein
MRGAIPVASNMVGVLFKLLFSIFWVFKTFSSITSVGYFLEFLFLEVLLCYGFAFVFSCYAHGVQICLTVYTLDSKTNISSTSFSEKELQYFRMRIKSNTS